MKQDAENSEVRKGPGWVPEVLGRVAPGAQVMLQRLRSGQEGQCELADEGVRDDAGADQAEPEIVLKLELSFVF